MQFIVKYIKGKETYYRTVRADSVNEASKIADKFAGKGFITVSVTQQQGKE